MRLSHEGLVGCRGRRPAMNPSIVPPRRHSRGAGTGAVSAPLIPLQGWIRATNVGAQPNQRLELAPPVVVELHLWKPPHGGAAQPPPVRPPAPEKEESMEKNLLTILVWLFFLGGL